MYSCVPRTIKWEKIKNNKMQYNSSTRGALILFRKRLCITNKKEIDLLKKHMVPMPGDLPLSIGKVIHVLQHCCSWATASGPKGCSFACTQPPLATVPWRQQDWAYANVSEMTLFLNMRIIWVVEILWKEKRQIFFMF